MIIVIDPVSAGESAVDTELQRAFVALRVVKIRVLGGGRFRDGTGGGTSGPDSPGDRGVGIAPVVESEARSLAIVVSSSDCF
jgi:hypothetical protein